MMIEYNNSHSGGISKDSREMLDAVNRQFPGPFEVSDCSKGNGPKPKDYWLIGLLRVG